MGHAANENECGMLSKDRTESPLAEEDNCCGSGTGGIVLKKGPWTSAEDAILIEYVKKHGEGNWNAVQKHSRLSRCGKSCRLRWTNHLRPNLKKGAFSQEEEQLIIELHAKMGNKWARMAAHLPGRTDNEIKNYWNTRIKRRQRAGLPLYPPEVSLQALQDLWDLNFSRLDRGDKDQHDLVQTNSYDLPAVRSDNLKANQAILPYVPELPGMTANRLLMEGLDSLQYSSFMSPRMHRQKRLRESATLLPGHTSKLRNRLPLFDHFNDDAGDKVVQSFGLSFPFDPDPAANLPQFDESQDSHALSNGNFSTSKPSTKALKLELPSLQYPETDLGGQGTSSPHFLLESVDNFIQSPRTSMVDSNCPSPRNSGLLDALLHEAKMLRSTKNHFPDKNLSSYTVTPDDIADSSTLNVSETEWIDYGDPLSPFGRNSTSLFSESAPVSASGSSLDEHEQPHACTFSGCNIKPEPVDQARSPDREKETSSLLDKTPDALPFSDWLDHTSGFVTEQVIMTDIQ